MGQQDSGLGFKCSPSNKHVGAYLLLNCPERMGVSHPLMQSFNQKMKKKKKTVMVNKLHSHVMLQHASFLRYTKYNMSIEQLWKKKCLKFVHQCHFFILQILFQVKLQFSYLIYAWKRRCLKDIPLLTSNYILVIEFNLLRFYLGSAYFVEIENLLLKVL